jgi:hypothetical protein
MVSAYAELKSIRVSACERLAIASVEMPSFAKGVIERWFIQEFGVVACEPNKVVNLNRCFPTSMKKAHLMRGFETPEEAEIKF